ncbi:sirohydrochlorin chelatase [Nocardia carnea]|uniref:Sirohydrochlorin chelatase n=1 Tax=Nocardia carnea TaxID=37328 RepID=A0ABW7TTG6_9NOCA|nr:CbiX/SirB N-terminal domain-containing protein [Nocardia carnea]
MNAPETPALVLVAHGTRSGKGVEMIAALAEAVGRELGHRPVPVATHCVHNAAAGPDTGTGRPARVRRTAILPAVHGTAVCGCAVDPELGAVSGRPTKSTPVRTAFVDVLGPSPSEVLHDLVAQSPNSAKPASAVVVPAFLASGYHVYQDVPREVRDSAHPAVTVTAAMGPDPALARIMAVRLRAAGWCPGDAVVFAAAGSSDPRARADVNRAAAMLTAQLATPVRTAYVATGAPRVPEIVAKLREEGRDRVFVASYLLAHGLFHERLHQAGATGVAAPIGVHPAVVRLIADRYRAALRERSGSPTLPPTGTAIPQS